MKPLTEAEAAAVWDVLVEHADASPAMRDEFVLMHVNGRCDEFRFIGALGFGGKFWRHNWRVTCYREDETAARLAIIAATNAALGELRMEQAR